MQIDAEITRITGDGILAEQMDIDVLDEKKEIEINTMKGLLSHRISILKRISQNVHGIYISLQGTEYQCSEALEFLTPFLTQ